MPQKTSDPESFSNSVYSAELTPMEFEKLSKFIMSEYGIKMPPEKKIMLQSRLQKRLKALNMPNFKEYVKYVFSPAGQSEEIIHMMDVVSTNKTDFFRESAHFDFLLSEGLPNLLNIGANNFNIWSAGCSSGEEPYSIAITMMEFKERHTGIEFLITGTDISTNMLQHAVTAIYTEDKVSDIPMTVKKKYFLRSKNREEKKVRIIPDIRKRVSYSRLNLLYLQTYAKPEYEIIFCRNVLIYFDRKTQNEILTGLCSQLKAGGYLFLGHSESVTGFVLPIESIKPTIFRKI